MNIELRRRQRVILGTALHEYEKLAKTTEQNLDALSLPTMQVQEAIGNVGVIQGRMGTTDSDAGQEIELTNDLVVTGKDALDFYATKVEKVKKDQLRLAIETHDVEHTVEEIQDLRDELTGQSVLQLR